MPNIIADIAGQYNTLLALLEKMPDDEPISVGDMVDRGPDSRKVIRFFQKQGRAVIGNHEHMMLDFVSNSNLYQHGIWVYNSGGATLKSFDMSIPDDVIDWVHSLPVAIKIDDVLVSHTFISEEDHPDLDNLDHPDISRDIVWSRMIPARRSDCSLQIAGHNSHWGLNYFTDDKGQYAIGIDQSADKILTGIHYPSMTVYEQEYLD